MSYVMSYLTTWSFILVVFHKWTHPYIHLLFLTTVVWLGGMWVVYRDPQRFVLNFEQGQYAICAPFLYVIDAVFHWLPFVFVAYTYGSYYTTTCSSRHSWCLWNTVLLLVLYMHVVHTQRQYHTKVKSEVVFTGAFMAMSMVFVIVGLGCCWHLVK